MIRLGLEHFLVDTKKIMTKIVDWLMFKWLILKDPGYANKMLPPSCMSVVTKIDA